MIKGIGIDIVEIERIARLMKKNDRFMNRILCDREIEEFNRLENDRRQLEYLAGRFAAKEAFSKALGTGIGEMRFTDIAIFNESSGAPYLEVIGYEKHQLFVSISHSHDYAVAQVIITE